VIGGLYGGVLSGLNGGVLSGLCGGVLRGLYGGVLSGLYGGVLSGLYGGVLSGLYGGVLSGLCGIVEAAEEQRGIGNVLQGLGPVVERGLEVLLGHRVAAHGPQGQHVFPHQPEVLT
jgi:hypothetical protein